jgi:hypothetical protein
MQGGPKLDAARKQLLIGVALVLAGIRFLIMPWLDSQADTREQLEVLTNRLDRSTGVVLNREAITTTLAKLEKANSADRARFPLSEDAESFRLEAQQRVTGVVETQGMRIDVFDWILDGPPDATGFGFVRGRINFTGDMRSLALLLGALEGELPNMVVREALYNFVNPVFGNGEYRASLTLVADFHYRRGPKP